MSLRIAPSSAHPTSTTNITTRTSTVNTQTAPQNLSKGAPSAPGLHDTLRANLTSDPSTLTSTPSSTHPLEARLLAWRQTQDSLKMEMLRRTYGIAEPVRRGMELKMVRDGDWRPAALSRGTGATSVHEDVLALGGRETEVAWEDVFHGDEFREPIAFHDEMEKKLKMDW